MSQENGRHAPSTKPVSYPLIDQQEQLQSAGGRTLNDVTLQEAANGALGPNDLQISGDTLRAQATIAAESGYGELAQNLRRAAELTAVPNDELLRMYEQLRPGRSSFEELNTLADELESQYEATLNASFVREAANVYKQRNLLRRN